MSRKLWFRCLLVLLVVVLAVSSLVAPLITGGGSPLRLGLDLRGGVELRYELPDASDLSGPEAEEQIATTRRIFQQRLDSHGVKEISVRAIGRDRIEVAIPGISAHEAVAFKKLLATMGRLEFRIVAGADEGFEPAFIDALHAEIGRRLAAGEAVTARSDFGAFTQGLVGEGELPAFRWYPLGEDGELGTSPHGPDVPSFVPLAVPSPGEDVLTGEHIEDAYPIPDERTGMPAVGFTVARHHRLAFTDFTEANVQRGLAIVLDGRIQSISTIKSAITNRGQISRPDGGFGEEELRRLVTVIRSGSLPLNPVLVSESEVGPQLGREALRRGLLVGSVALGLILGFLVLYYRRAGLVAAFALSVNVLLLLGALAALRATLTLPGIAGLVLTVGMAVDANILVFERIREELDRGGGVSGAISAGFDKALRTIVDANVTTFLTAFFLYRFGQGAIRGFAVTVMIGLATSMFSSVYVSRTVFRLMLRRGLATLRMPRRLSGSSLRWMRHRRLAMGASAVAVLVGAIAFLAQGEEMYGMDFTGGYEVQMCTSEPHPRAEILTRVRDAFPGADVVTLDASAEGARSFQVKVEDVAGAESLDATADPAERLGERLREVFRDDLVPDPVTLLDVGDEDELGRRPVELELSYRAPVEREDVVRALGGVLSDVSIRGPDVASRFTVGGAMSLPSGAEAGAVAEITRAVRELPAAAGSGTVLLTDPLPSRSYVGPKVGAELRDGAFRAIAFSLLAVVLYLRVRFRHYRFGYAACIALAHDVLVTVGMIAMLRVTGVFAIEIDLAIVAALLTIIGYSLNDTIVIFDRIRENVRRSKASLGEIIDASIGQTLNRTILTSLTTAVVLVVLFGTHVGQSGVLAGLALALLIGVVVGTYSTVFIASPALLLLARWEERRRARRSRGLDQEPIVQA